jgi:nucleoside-diphosphate-sugar epimerase
MARVLVTGANGFVGSHLAEHLLSLGHEVTCLVRETSDLAWLKGLPVRLAHGEAREPSSLPAAVEGQEYVFHAAGATRAWDEKGYIETNALGTLNMLRACAAQKNSVRKFILVSSQAAAGPSPDGVTVTEDMPPRPVSAYGRSKLLAEKFAHEFQDRLPVTIVRPTDVYGPRDHDGLYFFKDAKKRVSTIIGFRPAKLIATYVTDAAAGIVLAGLSEKSAGRTYFICSDKEHTWDQVVDAIAGALGVRVLKLRLHGQTVKMLGRWIMSVASFQRALGLRKKPPLLTVSRTIEVAERFWNCSCERAKRELGFAPKVDLKEGARMTVQWYREHGWL